MDKEEGDVILAHLKEVEGTTVGMTFTNPEDVMLAEEYMRQRYFFPDVHVRGYYGTVDYLEFSYYM
jgi:hypothetical protein